MKVATERYLISAIFQRTVKYLQSLAANITPVSYQWIERCYAEKKLLAHADYTLPAGVEISGNLIEW